MRHDNNNILVIYVHRDANKSGGRMEVQGSWEVSLVKSIPILGIYNWFLVTRGLYHGSECAMPTESNQPFTSFKAGLRV